MRARYHALAEVFFDELSKPGVDVRQATINAGRRLCWAWGPGSPLTDRQILKRAKAIMARPDWIENMRDLFEVAGGFSPVEGVRLAVQHMRGEIEVEKHTVTKDGEVIDYTEKLPPSLEALKHYHSLTVPKAVKQVQVDTRMLVAHRMASSEPPKMRARVLKQEALPAKAD